MNWRRGSALASIHVVAATILISSILIPGYSSERIHSANPIPTFHPAAYQEGDLTVEFAPICEEWRSISWQEKVLTTSELPAMVVSGWNSDCPARWTTAGLIGIDMKHHSRSNKLASSAALLLLIAIQWIFVGGHPLVEPRRWWLEPGAFNTACTLIACVFGMIATMLDHEILSIVFGVPAFEALLLAFFTWIAWLALLLWAILKSGWKFTLDNRKASRTT